jgi:hypothetical protein
VGKCDSTQKKRLASPASSKHPRQKLSKCHFAGAWLPRVPPRGSRARDLRVMSVFETARLIDDFAGSYSKPVVYVHGVWGAMLPMFAMFLNECGTAWGTNCDRTSDTVSRLKRRLRRPPSGTQPSVNPAFVVSRFYISSKVSSRFGSRMVRRFLMRANLRRQTGGREYACVNILLLHRRRARVRTTAL